MLANGLKVGKSEAKQLAAEMAKFEDALQRIGEQQKKNAEASRAASSEAAKALEAEIAALQEKQALLAAEEKQTLNGVRAAALQAQQAELQAQIDRRTRGAPPAPDAPSVTSTAPPVAPTTAAPASAAPAPASGELEALLKTIAARIEEVRIVVQQGQADLPPQIVALADALQQMLGGIGAALQQASAQAAESAAGVPVQIEQLGEVTASGFAAIAKATSAALQKLQKQIDTHSAQIARLG